MTIATDKARQGVVSENHAVAKVVMVSTSVSFLALILISAFGY